MEISYVTGIGTITNLIIILVLLHTGIYGFMLFVKLAKRGIKALDMIEGDLSIRALKLIREWAAKYQDNLMYMWTKKEFKKLDGLD